MKTHLIAQLGFWLLLLASAFFAWRRGGKAERMGSAIMVAGAALSMAAVAELANRFHSAEIGLFFVDLAVLAAFWALMLRSNRYWPIWASAFQLAGIMTHFAAFVTPHLLPASYAILQGLWAYPIIIVMLLGVFGQMKAHETGPARQGTCRSQKRL
jgi:hypothetical protein